MEARNLAGATGSRGRVENDFYATNPKEVEHFLLNCPYELTENVHTILEPCAGQGHIVNVLKQKLKKAVVYTNDIVNRGVHLDFMVDFTEKDDYFFDRHSFDFIITNPPFNCAQEIIENSFDVLNQNRFAAFLLKLSFLEGQKRKAFFEKFPPKYVLVCSHRVNIWRNGEETNENGKRWASTMAYAWFIWQKGYSGKTEVRWI